MSVRYRQETAAFGVALAQRGIQLVWGGAHAGLMGVLADAVLGAGGRAVGVMPQFLVDREVAYLRASELVVVDSMHARKAAMAERAEGFVLLPGGLGSFEEFFEVWTWAQLALHQKPIGVLNIAGFFDPLVALLAHTAREGFVAPAALERIVLAGEPGTLLDLLDARRAALGTAASADTLERI